MNGIVKTMNGIEITAALILATPKSRVSTCESCFTLTYLDMMIRKHNREGVESLNSSDFKGGS